VALRTTARRSEKNWTTGTNHKTNVVASEPMLAGIVSGASNQDQPLLLPWKRQRSIQLRAFLEHQNCEGESYEKRKSQQHQNSKGKATKKGNLNAMKHGAYSEMTILPHEDPKEFEALHEAVWEEYDPQGPTQEDRVLSIAKNLVAQAPDRPYPARRSCKSCKETALE